MTAGLVSSQFLMYGAIKDGKLYIKQVLNPIGRIHPFFFLPAIGAPPGLEIHKE